MSAFSILFATGSLSERKTGPSIAVNQTTRALKQRGHFVTVIGTRRKHEVWSDRWGVQAHAFRSYGPFSLHFAPGLARWLLEQRDVWDIASMQSVWLHSHRTVAEWCIKSDKPFMITTRGNFNSVALKISARKKWLARHTFMAPVFEHVTCYQALNDAEYYALREYGIREPICVIGNGINLPDLGWVRPSDTMLPDSLQGRKICLYLGRLHPIKGLERLLRAWARIQPPDAWQLVIAGDGDGNYRAELETIARHSQCRNVHFVGAVLGDVKSAWLHRANLFVMSSLSEGFPMALLEAFSFSTPALITNTCGFSESAKVGAALEVESSEDGIAAGLDEVLRWPLERLQMVGATARSFVGEHYSWSRICAQLESVYTWMRTKELPPPPCLRLN